MTILGRGDLSPPRRHRHGGPRAAAAVVVLLVLAAAGWFAWHEWHGSGSSHQVGPARPCVRPSVPPSPAADTQVTLAVLNTTDRVGLAHDVARQLRGRGFHVGRVGNTTPLIAGTATVTYARGQQPAALAVAEQVPGATLTAADTGGVTLRLGSGFRSLADPAAVAAARAHDTAAASPRPPVCGAS